MNITLLEDESRMPAGLRIHATVSKVKVVRQPPEICLTYNLSCVHYLLPV